jgi:hypothetical protein
MPEDMCLKLLLSNVLSNTRPRGDVSWDPQLVRSVVVTTCYEPVSEGVVVFFQLLLMYGVFGREVYGRNCEKAGGVFYRHTGCRDLMGDAGWSSLVLWQFCPKRFLLDGKYDNDRGMRM